MSSVDPLSSSQEVSHRPHEWPEQILGFNTCGSIKNPPKGVDYEPDMEIIESTSHPVKGDVQGS